MGRRPSPLIHAITRAVRAAVGRSPDGLRIVKQDTVARPATPLVAVILRGTIAARAPVHGRKATSQLGGAGHRQLYPVRKAARALRADPITAIVSATIFRAEDEASKKVEVC